MEKNLQNRKNIYIFLSQIVFFSVKLFKFKILLETYTNLLQAFVDLKVKSMQYNIKKF